MTDEQLWVIVAGAASHSTPLLREMEMLAVQLGAALGGVGRAAWYDQGRPALVDLLDEAVTAGVTRIVVVPFLLQWRFPDHFSLPAQLHRFGEDYPSVAIHLAAPLGLAPVTADLFQVAAATALSGPTVTALGVTGLQEFARQRPLPKRPPAPPPLPPFAHHLLLCQGRACLSAGATILEAALRAEAAERGLVSGIAGVRFTRTRCLGPCGGAAVVACYPAGDWYHDVEPTQAAALLDTITGAGDQLLNQRLVPAEG